MAINYNGAALLLSAKQRGFRLGSVLTLGRQHFSLTSPEIASLERTFSVDLKDFVRRQGEEIFAEPFLRYLGASAITSVDFSDYEGSSFCHDLNEPIPEQWKGKYDTVIDGGTLEHVFDFPTAIRNVMELLAPGGYFFGDNPADNWLGHGFYQFNPELFYRVFTHSNGFEVIDSLLAEDKVGGVIYKVTDPAIVGHRIRLCSRLRLYTLVLARKNHTVDNLLQETPQQSDYTTRWESMVDGAVEVKPKANLPRQMFNMLLPAQIQKILKSRNVMRRKGRWL